MARFRIFLPRGFTKTINSAINRRVNSRVLKTIGDEVVADMRKGINPKTGRRFKRITDVWSKRRERLKTKNRTHKDYGKGKSNLTFTGRFLDSIKVRFSRKRGSRTILIEPTGTHRGYNLIKGGRTKSVSNKDIAEGLAQDGRSVFSLSKKRINSIKRILKKALRF